MAIKKKTEISKKAEEFISKGGKVYEDDDVKDSVKVTFRFPYSLLERLDTHLKTKPGIPRSVWVYDAIYAKLEKEENHN